MKVLFLDIDGVVNCKTTTQRHRGFIGIDPFMAFMVGKIELAVKDLKIVLSSSWRHSPDGIKEVNRQVLPIYDVTPRLFRDFDTTLCGDEIKAWLEKHPEVQQYAILDDDSDMLPEQLPNFFQTSWDTGITQDIVNKIITHLT